MSNLDAALAYAASGWPVFLVMEREKSPATAHGKDDATTDVAIIRKWWKRSPNANIGVPTGAVTGIVVLDVDADKGGFETIAQLEGEHGPLPTTLTAVTGGGGRHFVFAHPGGKVGNRANVLRGLDVRGDGGYIVVDPSTHPSGQQYRWIDPDARIEDAPTWLMDLICGKPVQQVQAHTKMPSGNGHSAYAEAAMRGEVEKLAHAVEGSRNDQANLSAFALGQLVGAGALERTLVEEQLQTVARSIGLSDREALATIRSGIEAGMQQPRQIPHNGNGNGYHAQPQVAAPADINEPSPEEAPHTNLLNTFALTDAGNGEVFAHLFGERVRYNHRRKQWLIWNGTRWQSDADGEIERLAIETARKRLAAALAVQDPDRYKKVAGWALQSEARYRRRAMLESAAILKPIADPGDGWDEDDWLLGCENGVVDLRTGTLRPGRPEDRITMSTGVVFDPNAKAERWGQFLEEIFGSAELIDYVWRHCGYSSTGSTREQVIAVCYGTGSNGKSVFLAALRKANGEYSTNTAFSTLELADRNASSNDVAALVGRRIVTASEVRESAWLNEARVKALTGGDPITARFLYSEYFTFQPKAKLWLAVNHKPRVHDDSYGFWRRIRLIPFTRTFDRTKADKNLDQVLTAEAPGILAWMVRGCLEWQRRGLEPPPMIFDATNQYRQESDPLASFFAERCILDAAVQCRAGDLYKAYCAFSKEYGEEPMSSTRFGRLLAERGLDKYRPGGNTKTRYIGIALREGLPE